ncbi:hypothetical protein HGA91_00645 [candidate division WWE3 bacterium]|nr:hypothetical protein [candidate division WWE3 bacterium]
MDNVYNRLNVGDIKALFQRFDVRPSKRWGQNFLIQPAMKKLMVDGLMPTADDRVIEIGGGLGSITLAVAPHVGAMTVFEIDPKLAPILSGLIKEIGLESKITIVQADYLISGADVMDEGNYKIIASLPYSITSPILHKLMIDFHDYWSLGIFLMQKEVMEKIVQGPTHGNYWYHFIHFAYHVEVLQRVVRPDAFWPMPGVDSSIIRVTRSQDRTADEMKNWSDFLHRVFQFPRKQISYVFDQEILIASGITPTARPGELSLDQLTRLQEQLR